jgi:hypothetical protein
MGQRARVSKAVLDELPTPAIDSNLTPCLPEDHRLAGKDDLASPHGPKYRSDLAFAAGFAALTLILFRFSLIPFLFELAGREAISDVLFLAALPLPGLPAPLALWLGLAAWSDLKCHPEKSGKIPAVVGIIIGFLGTLILLSETYQVVTALWRLT